MSVRHASPRTLRAVVALSVVAAVVFVASVAIVATLYATGREDAIEDNSGGALLISAMGVGVLGSLVSFAWAVVARLRGDRRPALWLPLLVLPAILLFATLGEAFWWE